MQMDECISRMLADLDNDGAARLAKRVSLMQRKMKCETRLLEYPMLVTGIERTSCCLLGVQSPL